MKQKFGFFFEKFGKINKPISKLTKRQSDNVQINKIRNKKGLIITDIDMKEIIRL